MKQRPVPQAPVDVITALSRPLEQSTTLVVGQAQLQIGGPSLAAPDGTLDQEVDVLEERGKDVRVGLRLANAHFAVWTSRARLLAELTRDVELAGAFGIGDDRTRAVLRVHARVMRLAHEGERTKIRYVGALELEGWVPDNALADRGPAHRSVPPRRPPAHRSVMLMPGAIIRTEPKWAATQLAVVNDAYFVDEVAELDPPWLEVTYEDVDVFVHGAVSKQDPPGRTHPRTKPEQATPTPPNATVADHTCLYAGREPIGFLVGDQQVLAGPGDGGSWMTITLDTPWGPVDFEAKGATEATLDTCGT